MIRRQLPVYSPLPLKAVAMAASAAARGRDSRPDLRDVLRARYGTADALLTDSGTQALQAAFSWIRREGRLQRGVALPAFGCFDLVSAAVGAGVPVFFYDLDPESLAPDVASFERALRAGAGAVTVAPLYGIPVPWGEILKRTRAHGAVVVEDAAQGFGLHRGPGGDFVVLSFGRGKGWTGGRGGALLPTDPFEFASPGPSLLPSGPLAAWMLSARAAAHCALGRPALYGLPSLLPWLALGETVYHPPSRPRRITTAAAALALATLAPSEKEVGRRRELARDLLARLERRGSPELRPVRPEAGLERPAFLRLPLRGNRGVGGFSSRREALRLGILPSYPKTLPDLCQAKGLLDVRGGGCHPGASELVRSLLTVPTHSLLTEADSRDIGRMLTGYAEGPATGPAHLTGKG